MQYQKQIQEKIQCRVERIFFPKPNDIENLPNGLNFFIISTDAGTVKGQLSWVPKVEERLLLTGRWQTSKFSGGQEFVFSFGQHDIPVDERSVLKYACELTLGIGPVTEQAIWDAKGEQWRTVSAEDGIPKVTAKVVRDFQETIRHLELEKEKIEAISYLISKGASIRMAESAWTAWERATISKVEADCFALAELKNFSFRDVDTTVRPSFGIADNDPRRVRAAALYFMGQLSSSATLISWRELNNKMVGVLNVSPQLIADTVRSLFKDGRLIPFTSIKGIAMKKAYDDEKIIYDFISRRAVR